MIYRFKNNTFNIHFFMLSACISLTLLGIPSYGAPAGSTSQKTSKPQPSSASPSTQGIDFADGTVFAHVSGKPINMKIFTPYFNLLNKKFNLAKKPYMNEKLAKKAAQPLIEQLLLREALKRAGLSAPQALIDSRIEALKKQMPDPKKLKQYFYRKNHTLDSFRLHAWNKEASFILLKRRGKITATQADMQSLYTRMKSRFIKPERARARQIFIEVKPKAEPEVINKAFKRSQEIYAEVLKGERPFEVYVQHFSEGPFRRKNGDLGYFARGDLIEAVENTVFSLKEGELSQPIRSPIGWHILKRLDSIPAQEKSLEEVKETLIERIERKKFHTQLKPLLKSLWAKAKIEGRVPLSP